MANRNWRLTTSGDELHAPTFQDMNVNCGLPWVSLTLSGCRRAWPDGNSPNENTPNGVCNRDWYLGSARCV
eukprot:11203939-Lingulodinium_polyedra.AAC.1